jgi:hypothetical protein
MGRRKAPGRPSEAQQSNTAEVADFTAMVSVGVQYKPRCFDGVGLYIMNCWRFFSNSH